MLHAALWAAGLLACLCLVALGAALGGRSAKRWMVVLTAAAAAAAPLALSTAAVAGAVTLRGIGSEPSWLAYAAAWGGAFAIGGAAILLLAIRRRADGSLASASWPRLRLLGGCLLGIFVFFLSLGQLDGARLAEMAARERAIREEASALFARPPVPEAENAAPHYLRAFEIIDELSVTGDFASEAFEPGFDALKWRTSEAPEERARREEALRAIREAVALPHMKEVGSSKFASYAEGHSLHFRDAAVLLTLDARTRASSGDMEGAFSSAAGMWRLAGHSLEGSRNLLEFSTACAISDGASRILEDLLGLLGDREPPASAGAPPSDPVFYPRVAPEIDRERVRVLGFLLRLFQERAENPATLPGVDRLVDVGPEIGTLIGKPYLALYRCFVLPGDLDALGMRLSELTAIARRPFPEARPGILELEEELMRRPGGLFSGMFLPPIEGLAHRAAAADARCVLARTGLAAAAHRARRGAYPTRLDDLVPDFLAAVPLDPLDGKPLKLAAAGGGLVLYSVGEDGIDDGGAEPEGPGSRKGDITFRLGAAYAARGLAGADGSSDEIPSEE